MQGGPFYYLCSRVRQEWRLGVTVKRPICRQGVTLVEVLVSSVVFMIVVLGTIAFRYNAALGARKADLQVAAARFALLLSEAWRAAPDANAFDPTSLTDTPELLINLAADGPPAPTGSIPLGSYVIVADGASYSATLSSGYEPSALPLRTLNVAVRWQLGAATSLGYKTIDKVFTLTTYRED